MLDHGEDLDTERATFSSRNGLQTSGNTYFESEASGLFSISTPALFVSRACVNRVTESVWIKNILVKQRW